MSDPTVGVTSHVDAQLPGVRTSVGTFPNAPCHAKSSGPIYPGQQVWPKCWPEVSGEAILKARPPLSWVFLVGLARIELATSALSVLRSNQLSYSPGNRCTTLHQGPGTAADGTHAAGAQAPTGRWTSPPRQTPRPPGPPRPPRPPRPAS